MALLNFAPMSESSAKQNAISFMSGCLSCTRMPPFTPMVSASGLAYPYPPHDDRTMTMWLNSARRHLRGEKVERISPHAEPAHQGSRLHQHARRHAVTSNPRGSRAQSAKPAWCSLIRYWSADHAEAYVLTTHILRRRISFARRASRSLSNMVVYASFISSRRSISLLFCGK
jgi:hypothetical protein